MNRLSTLIIEHGLSKRCHAILRSAKPSYSLVLTPGQPEAAASRFGGLPLLARDQAWPRRPDGRPLTFLGQINVAELPSGPSRQLLPDQGLLSFFYDVGEQPWGLNLADRTGWHVAHARDPHAAVPRSEDGLELVLPSCAVQILPDVTIPAFRSIEILPLCLDDDELDRYEQLRDAVVSRAHSEAVHRVLGHPDAIQGCMQRGCQFESRGLELPEGVYSWCEHPRAEELMPGAHDWRLLLQIDSDPALDVMWGDAGRIFFWIPEDALLGGRFDETWLALQCY